MPGYFSILKIFGVIFFVLSFFKFQLNERLYGNEILLAIFLVSAISVFLAKKIYIHSGSDLFLNVIFCALPFFILSLRRDFELFYFFLQVCTWLLIAQIFLDFYIRSNGHSLWDNRAFVGGLGNPSSFGLFCNIVLCNVLFLRRFSFSSIFLIIFIVYAITETKSLFSLAAMAVVFLYFIWRRTKSGFFLFLIFIGAGIYLFSDSLISGHLAYKISSLQEIFSAGESEGSQSITLRVEIHQIFFEKLADDFLSVLFFGYHEAYYYNADSQFLSFFGSFGVLSSMLFFFSIFYCLLVIKPRHKESDFFWISISLFVLMFFSNRIVDYYPMQLILFLLVFGSRRFIASSELKRKL